MISEPPKTQGEIIRYLEKLVDQLNNELTLLRKRIAKLEETNGN